MSALNSSLPLTSDSTTRVREVKPYELARIKPLPLIIDIREEEEFVSGHIAGAQHISSGPLEDRIREVVPEPDTGFLIYCAVGDRAPFGS
jgi:hydroxyacylglutathione hydrolase